MIKIKLPPKTPPPDMTIVNHHTLLISWEKIITRLVTVLGTDDTKWIIELSMKKINNFDEPWIVKYTGFAEQTEVEDLDQDSVYNVRIRLRNSRGWGEYSDENSIQTPKEPITGDDLHRAIIMDDEALLLKLLESGQIKINIPDRYDYTPLMACTVRNLEKLMKCLLDFGVDINIQNKVGKTALMLASNKGNTRMVQLLLKGGADAKLTDRLGMTALFYAVDSENIHIVRMLIDAGCDVNQPDSESSWTPLIRLAVLSNNGNPKIGSLLIQNGALVNYQDSHGHTPLIHCAFHMNHSELARVLINNGANIDIINKSGHTVYQIARSMNNTNMIELLTQIRKTDAPN